MVPIARLKFYGPELKTNRPDEPEAHPYHEFGLPILWLSDLSEDQGFGVVGPVTLPCILRLKS